MSIPAAAANRHQRWGLQQNPAICGAFRSALGRTRTCGLLIRSHSRSETGTEIEGQGETKQRFYRQLSASKGTGWSERDTGLWYRCGMEGRWPIVSEVGLELMRLVRATGFESARSWNRAIRRVGGWLPGAIRDESTRLR